MISVSDGRFRCLPISIPPPPPPPPPLTRRITRNTHLFTFIPKSQKYPTRILASSSSIPFGLDKENLVIPRQEPTWQNNRKKPLHHIPIPRKGNTKEKKNDLGLGTGKNTRHVGSGQEQMWLLCGIGYWVQGFRCFPWLALNFHMTNGLGLGPSTLQLVQNIGNLPMVAKPIYGVLSDSLYIGGAHRLPYISFGVFLQALSWGTLAMIPMTGDTFPTQMACILMGNLGASFTEVVSDALVAEFSKTRKAGALQSYAYMALAGGGILGNLSGGFFLLKSQQPKLMFLAFAFLLTLQLALSLTTREDTLYSTPRSKHQFSWTSVSESLSMQFSNLFRAITVDTISRPLAWIVASVAAVPLLSGTMFCFQTQCLNLNPYVIGLSKVVGQFFFLSATLIYNQYLKKLPMRDLIFGVQTLYAVSILSDLLLVKQINLSLGISNEIHVLCLSAIAEAAAQFKILPFTVLLSGLCPSGCEGSLFAFFASVLCLASIISGVLGVGLSSILGLSSGSYSALPLGIVLQSIAALVPLLWISYLPGLQMETPLSPSQTRYAKRSWKRLEGKNRLKWSLP